MRYGFYSQTAKDHGVATFWYATLDGGEIEVTATAETPDYTQGWPDLICLGQVGEFLRHGQEE